MFFLRDPQLILYIAITLVISISIHEASHALSADLLGDPTARRMGRLTLNPLAHFDPMGAMVLIISSLAGFGIGWGKPCPVNPQRLTRGILKNLSSAPRVGMALVALAGPLSNVLLALLGIQVLRAMPVSSQFVDTFISVNIVLAVFNLIPLPPLDGYKVLLGLLPNRPAISLARVEAWGPGILILVVFLMPGVLNRILVTFSGPIYRLLGG